MAGIRRFAMWLVWNVPLGRFAPRVMQFAMGPGVKMKRIK